MDSISEMVESKLAELDNDGWVDIADSAEVTEWLDEIQSGDFWGESDTGEHGEGDYIDVEYTDMSHDSSPWEFEIPNDVLEIIAQEKVLMEDPEFEKNYDSFHWRTIWPNVKHDEIDVAQAAADYYLLFGLINNSFVSFETLTVPSLESIQEAGRKLGLKKTVINKRVKEVKKIIAEDPRIKFTEIAKKAEPMFHDLVEELDVSFREYVHLACGGELRHHKAFQEVLDSKYRRGAWVHWYFIYEKYGASALPTMAKLFREFGAGPYGGEAWAAAAEILYAREIGELGPDEFTNKQLFVDRVFTLEHNGGCFLNKLEWTNKREKRQTVYRAKFHMMKDTVLAAHCTNPINIDMLFGYASEEVQKLVQTYMRLAVKHDIEIEGIWKKKIPATEPVSVTEAPPAPSGEVPTWSGKKMIDWDAYVDKVKVEPETVTYPPQGSPLSDGAYAASAVLKGQVGQSIKSIHALPLTGYSSLIEAAAEAEKNKNMQAIMYDYVYGGLINTPDPIKIANVSGV